MAAPLSAAFLLNRTGLRISYALAPIAMPLVVYDISVISNGDIL